MFGNKIFRNASWIIICKIGQSLCSLIVTMVTARCLGPSNYGLIAYANSLLAFALPVALLGLDNVQVQELVEYKEQEGKVLGTSIFMSFLSSIACFFGIFTFTTLVNADEKTTIIVCTLYSISLFFQGCNLMQYWFQARYFSKYSSIANLIVYFLVCGYKVYLILSGKSIYWFALSNSIDFLLSFILLSILYRKHGGQKFGISGAIAKRMFHKSKYYILVNLMVVIFGQTDRVMLKLMIDDAATGFYSAALTCANLLFFVFNALIDSSRPMIFEAHQYSKPQFEKHVTMLYSGVVYLSLAVGIGISIFAPIIVHIIYGSSYEPTIVALRIAVWYIPFSFIGVIRNIWVLAEGKQKWLMPINIAGAILNVGMNFLLIPLLGINGAALATLLTQFLTNVVVSTFFPDIRRGVVLLMKGLNPKYLVLAVKNLLKKDTV